MEALEPRVKFIEPMGFEMSEELIERYAKIILQSKKDTKCARWGTYDEKIKEVHFELHSKEIKKNVEKMIESISKESGMTRKEFDEIKGIALEMKASGKSKVLEATTTTIVAP